MDIKLLLITIFLGWFGIDKYVAGGKKAWKIATVKLLSCIIFIGAIWNIYDIIQIARQKYEIDPREYLA